MDFRVLLTALVLFGVSKMSSGGVGYKAAVFEHRPRHDALQSPRQVVESNLRFFEKAVKVAAGKKVDIIVFNEYGLFPHEPNRDKMRPFMEQVPDPRKEKPNPCVEVKSYKDRFMLSSLSCLARDNKIYIVANIGDVQPCNNMSLLCKVNNTANKTANNTANKTTNNTVNNTANKTANNTANKTANNSANKTANNTANKTANNTHNNTANNTANKTANNTVNKTTNNTANKTANNTHNNTHNNTANKTANNTANNTANKTANNTHNNMANKTANKTANNTANKMANSCQSKCPTDGVYMYNTNVVFDRDGNLVARYHKLHPYFETMNMPTEEDNKFSYFDTSFGRFGLITCFDTAWYEAVVLARDFKIDAMVYTTHWYDHSSSWSAVEWQQSWAIANRVDFLAANSHYPGLGILGSGIYSKDFGALVYTSDPDGESKLLMASLPDGEGSQAEIIVVKEDSNVVKKETGAHFQEYCDDNMVGRLEDPNTEFRCYKSHFEDYHLVKLVNSNDHLVSCDNGGFCCSLKYTAEGFPEGFYLAVRNYTNDNGGYYRLCEETCVLIRCDPSDEKLCVYQRSFSKLAFKSFEMRARFTSEIVYPTVSKDSYRLAPKSEWKYERKGEYAELKFRTSGSEGLLKAGLQGRCYQRDPPFVNWYDVNP